MWHGHGRLLAAAATLAAALTGCDHGIAPEPDEAVASGAAAPLTATLFVSGLEGSTGSAIGPGGALYVAEAAAGRIVRIDPRTGAVSTFAAGLPPSVIGLGGVSDIAFIGATAYALVTLVGPDVGGADVVGIYRIDGPDSHTVIADIGAFAIANPPETDFFVPTGVQYSMEPWRGAFLVADGHHNRVLHVTLAGQVTELMVFGNTVPTGLAASGNTIYMAEAGPVPHLPKDGRVVAFSPKSSTAAVIAAGGRLLVDVEFGRGRKLYALAQGIWDGVAEGSPALPFTGELLEVKADGTFAVVASALNQPTSMELIGTTAFIVSLAGQVWRIEGVGDPPFGRGR